jgi:hypothetical protein
MLPAALKGAIPSQQGSNPEGEAMLVLGVRHWTRRCPDFMPALSLKTDHPQSRLTMEKSAYETDRDKPRSIRDVAFEDSDC